MRDLWFSDNRDIVKWAFLVHLARTHKLKTVIQVPYWRPEVMEHKSIIGNQSAAIDDGVWSFFRDIRHAERLGQHCNVAIKIFREQYGHPASARNMYAQGLSQYLDACERPFLLFLDPDTGLEPAKCNITHTSKSEVERSWQDLHSGDWLVFYQHARRELDWADSVSRQLSKVCGGTHFEQARSETIGKEVAFLFAKKELLHVQICYASRFSPSSTRFLAAAR